VDFREEVEIVVVARFARPGEVSITIPGIVSQKPWTRDTGIPWAASARSTSISRRSVATPSGCTPRSPRK